MNYQRYWNVENEEHKKLEKELKSYKAKLDALRRKRQTYENLEIQNELNELENLQKDCNLIINFNLCIVAMLNKLKEKKDKSINKLKAATEYDDKVSSFLDELTKKK